MPISSQLLGLTGTARAQPLLGGYAAAKGRPQPMRLGIYWLVVREGKMKIWALFVGLAVLGLSAFQPTNAQSPAASPAADREARWRQDLKFFADQFGSHQTDFTKLYPQPGFNSELAGLQADIPKRDLHPSQSIALNIAIDYEPTPFSTGW